MLDSAEHDVAQQDGTPNTVQQDAAEKHIVLFWKKEVLFTIRHVDCGSTLEDLRAASQPWQRTGKKYLYFTHQESFAVLDLIISGLPMRAETHQMLHGLYAAPAIPRYASDDVRDVLSQYEDLRHFGVVFACKEDADAIRQGISLVTQRDLEIEVARQRPRRRRRAVPPRDRAEAASSAKAQLPVGSALQPSLTAAAAADGEEVRPAMAAETWASQSRLTRLSAGRAAAELLVSEPDDAAATSQGKRRRDDAPRRWCGNPSGSHGSGRDGSVPYVPSKY